MAGETPEQEAERINAALRNIKPPVGAEPPVEPIKLSHDQEVFARNLFIVMSNDVLPAHLATARRLVDLARDTQQLLDEADPKGLRKAEDEECVPEIVFQLETFISGLPAHIHDELNGVTSFTEKV